MLSVVLFAAALAGCGDSETPTDAGENAGAEVASPEAVRSATLVLDFLPGPVHAGIYLAQDRGYYREAGIDLRIIEPTSTADTLRLIDAGRADFGLADGMDIAGQIDEGRGAKAIMAITQRPSGGVITLAERGFETPGDLAGGTVGVTGVPSDDAVLGTILEADGLSLDAVEKVTIGFNGVQNLENGAVDAFVGYIPADGVQVEVDGYPTRSFAFDEYGGPAYPGLVAFSTESRIAAEPEMAASFADATRRGYEEVIASPDEGVSALLESTVGIDAELAEAGVAAYLDRWEAGDAEFGTLSRRAIAELIRFMDSNDLIDEPFGSERFYTPEFAGQAAGAPESDGG